MAGTRIQGSFKSYANIEYKIFIYDATFVASVTDKADVIGDPTTGNVWGDPTTGNVWGWDSLDGEGNTGVLQTQYVGVGGFHLEYETENENLYTPLMPSRLTFKLIFENEDQEAFLTQLANSYEGQFLVRVLKNDVLFWVGVLMPDVVSYEDQYYPFEFNFVAIDGLARLKGIEYPSAVLNNGSRETIMAVIFACLGQLETNGFYGAGDDYFITNNAWWEVRHSASLSNDPLVLTRFLSSALYEQNSTTGEIEFFSCYDVLKQICTVFGARLFQANGTWWFQQVFAYNNSVQTRRVYTKTAVQTYATGGQSYELTVNQSTLARSKGRYEFLPPLKQVKVTYKHRSSTASLLNGVTWDYTTDGTVTTVGDVASNGATAKIKFVARLHHTFRIPNSPNPPDPDVIPTAEPHYFRVQLKVGSYYFDGVNSEWSLTPSYFIFACTPAQRYQVYIDTVEFITPAVPADGACTISFEYYYTTIFDDTVIPDQQYDTTLTLSESASTGIAYWVEYSPQLVVLADGIDANTYDFVVYQADNTNTGNSKIVDLTVYFGDGPNATALPRMQTSNGSTWADSTLWGGSAPSSRTEKILERLASKIMQAQLTPRIKYVGNLISTTTAPYFPYSRLKIGLKYYVFLGGTFEADQDTWTNLHIFNIKTDQEIEATQNIPKT